MDLMTMQNFKQFLSENQLIDIKPKDIKIENGVMIPNQFPNKVIKFDCHGLKHLTSLENCPNEVNDFFCDGTSITSLEFVPKIINDTFSCSSTKIESLDYAPLKCLTMYCNGNNILHLKGIGRSYLKECRSLYLPNTIKSNILGLCRVKNLKNITIYDKGNQVASGDLFDAIQIVKNYLETDGSDCQEELIQNGFNDYAKF
jgi:hypothetical protein